MDWWVRMELEKVLCLDSLMVFMRWIGEVLKSMGLKSVIEKN